jgi:very-short-patch-repair endonuclease
MKDTPILTACFRMIWLGIVFYLSFQFVSWGAIFPTLLLALVFYRIEEVKKRRYAPQAQQKASGWQPGVRTAMHNQARRNQKNQPPRGQHTLFDKIQDDLQGEEVGTSIYGSGQAGFENWYVCDYDDDYPEYEYYDSLLHDYRRRHPHFDSPIEEAFWEAWHERNMQSRFILVPQHPIGKYRVDFAHIPTMTAIELDGHTTHSSPDAIAKDRKRQREIEEQGWHVIRFGGKEVHSDATACAIEALRYLASEEQRNRKTP